MAYEEILTKTTGVSTEAAQGLDDNQKYNARSNIGAAGNAFSNVQVGSTTVAADSPTDTLTLVAGDNITLTPDATTDNITISTTITAIPDSDIIALFS